MDFKKKLKIWVILIILLVPSVLGVSNAIIREGSCPPSETCFLETYQKDNSHVVKCQSPQFYNYSICLPISSDLVTVTLRNGDCEVGENFLLSLYSESNTHISLTESYYNFSLCSTSLKIDNTCNLDKGIRIFSNYQEGNSHIGSFNYYLNNFCLEYLTGIISRGGGGVVSITCPEGEKLVDGVCKKTLKEIIIERIKQTPNYFFIIILIILAIIGFIIYYFRYNIEDEAVEVISEPYGYYDKCKDKCYEWIDIVFGDDKKKPKKKDFFKL